MEFAPPPGSAAWQHIGDRAGSEVAFFAPLYGGYRIEGTTTAAAHGRAWTIDYAIRLDATWTTKVAEIRERSETGVRALVLEQTTPGHWTVDGVPNRRLDGCLDVELESSVLTGALPVHRQRLPIGRAEHAPAAFVGTPGLSVRRLDRVFTRIGGDRARQVVDYAAPAVGAQARLTYDANGLLVAHPTVAVRVL